MSRKNPADLKPVELRRHPDYWDDPETFAPERFETGRLEELPPFAYFPFGGGPRLCIGNSFAMMEMQLVVATLAQQMHVDLLPGQSVALSPAITLRPRNGILMTLRERG